MYLNTRCGIEKETDSNITKLARKFEKNQHQVMQGQNYQKGLVILVTLVFRWSTPAL